MSDPNDELDKTIEELEAEVIAELEAELQKLEDAEAEIEEKIKSISVKEDVEALVEGEELSEGPKTKDQHLEFFANMKATEVKEMLKAYQSSLAEQDEDEEDEEEALENAKKEAIEKRIKDIDVKEDVNALVSEDDSLSEEFKEKAATIFEAAVKSKVRGEVERIHDEVDAEKETEMDAFKDTLSEKVDTYLNYVVEEWMKENELAIEGVFQRKTQHTKGKLFSESSSKE